MSDGSVVDKIEVAQVPQLPRSGAVVADESLCLACRECEVACSLYHEGKCSPSLSRIRIEFDDFAPASLTVLVCKQCDWPACVYACAARWDEPAMSVDKISGARYVNPDRCRGCGACMRACPLTPERSVMGLKMVGRKRVYFKCDLCHNRPEGPVCVEACSGGALKFVPAAERPG